MVTPKPVIGLIDADLFCYDITFACQSRDPETGEVHASPFSRCVRNLDLRMKSIQEATGCTEFELYLTGKNNFRHDIATILLYKGGRSPDKPYHYKNMRKYLEWRFDAEVIDGMEADDMLAIRQTQLQDSSCIVSRDKDLRMVPGWHYSWGVTNQPEKPLEHITELGYLTLQIKTKENNGKTTKSNKLVGGGLRFFYAQILMGDKATDNIQGLPKVGDRKAYDLLKDCENEAELYARTLEAYTKYYDDETLGYNSMQENAQLLWMVRSIDENQNPVMWRMFS